ncbi:MAG: hypothetical protein N3D10_02565 [Candidatus Micrarchaeota archaeon]|nr:hypothetical protein [Candidatus Micrarchaeota archaeon]
MQKAIFLLFLTILLFGCIEQPKEEIKVPPYKPEPTIIKNDSSVQPYPITPIEEKPKIQKNFELSFLNVGFGDSTLLLSQDKVILIDVGPKSAVNLLLAELQRRGVNKIDLLVLSASHDPAFSGGLKEIVSTYEIDEIWTNSKENLVPYLSYLNGTKIEEVEFGKTYNYGNLNVVVLNPSPDRVYNLDADSLVLKISYNNLCALVFSKSEGSGASTADPGTVFGGVDNKIISMAQKGGISLNCPILKVSNHGSGNAASFQLLDVVNPSIAIISVGPNQNNLYPNVSTLRRLALKGISIYTTDRLGTITVSSKDGLDYMVFTDFPRDMAYAKFLNEVVEKGKPYWAN